MRFPHPWLARLALAGMYFGAAVGVAIAGIAVWPTGTSGTSLFYAWLVAVQSVTTAREAWAASVGMGESVAGALAAPIGWLLAAWLMRLAATGRLRFVGSAVMRLTVARLPAILGMWIGALASAFGVARWIDPQFHPFQNTSVVARARNAVTAGQTCQFPYELAIGDNGNLGSISQAAPLPAPLDQTWRIGRMVCSETYLLFLCTRSAGGLFLLCGVIYCLSHLRIEDET